MYRHQEPARPNETAIHDGLLSEGGRESDGNDSILLPYSLRIIYDQGIHKGETHSTREKSTSSKFQLAPCTRVITYGFSLSTLQTDAIVPKQSVALAIVRDGFCVNGKKWNQ